MAWPTACCASPSICWPGATSRWSSRPSHLPGSGPPETQDSYPVHRVPSVPLPGYWTFRLGLSAVTCHRWLAGHGADLVHLASPFVLGARGAAAAQRLGQPVIAVYQTDVPGYARV